MSEKSEKSFSKIPFRVYIVYLLVASFLFTGVAFSKYVTSGFINDRARVASIGEVIITETGDFSSSSVDGDTTENSYIVIPGVDLTKDVRLRFDGSEMACYVFLQVDPNGFTTTDNYHFAQGKISWAIDDSWTFLKEDGGVYVYYHIVAANAAIENKAILEDSKVTVNEQLIRSELNSLPGLLNITFKATAAQYDGFGNFDTEEEHALAAWNSVSAH